MLSFQPLQKDVNLCLLRNERMMRTSFPKSNLNDEKMNYSNLEKGISA